MASPESPTSRGAIADRIVKIDHVAIAVPDMGAAAGLFVGVFGATLIAGGDNDATGVRLMQLACGGFKLELMQSLRPDSLIAAQLNRAGPGFHHVTVQVDDLERTIDGLDAAGVPRTGTDLSSPRWRETFLSPRASFGALFQLVDTTLRWDLPAAGYTVHDVVTGQVVWRDHIACLRGQG